MLSSKLHSLFDRGVDWIASEAQVQNLQTSLFHVRSPQDDASWYVSGAAVACAALLLSPLRPTGRWGLHEYLEFMQESL